MKKCVTCRVQYRPSIELSKKDREKSRFCSRKCYWAWMKYNVKPPARNGYTPWNKGNGKILLCQQCSVEFYVPKRRIATAKCCSKQCSYINAKKRVVSLETRRKISKNSPIKGENNPFWKGGISKINKNNRKLIMETIEYKCWRTSVFKRDNYTCQICKDKQGGNLHANHIKKFSEFPKLWFDINNGITLCKTCHISKVTHHESEFEEFFINLIKGGRLNANSSA